MARITVEDCLEREGNRFALVLLAAKRTKQLLTGAEPLTKESKNKPLVTALREIAEGTVRFMTEEDRQKVEELERHRREASITQAQDNLSLLSPRDASDTEVVHRPEEHEHQRNGDTPKFDDDDDDKPLPSDDE